MRSAQERGQNYQQRPQGDEPLMTADCLTLTCLFPSVRETNKETWVLVRPEIPLEGLGREGSRGSVPSVPCFAFTPGRVQDPSWA